jgi:muramoyltetrapeptide carboxypeptidase
MSFPTTSSARWPEPLAPGARVALVAPAGPLRGEADLARAIENARGFGWDPRIGAHALAHSAYFAGSDAERLGDLQRALDDPRVDAVWCIRGGYGAMRLLGRLDLGALARRPKPLFGYSDITALHCAIAARTRLVSFHGPGARAVLTPFPRDSHGRAVVERRDSCGEWPLARTLRGGAARGRLAGGNVALLAALAGTSDAPCFDGAIVVLEDINEAVYRIDRMLQQLRLAGIFRGCRALVFGQCTGCPEQADEDGARRLDDVIAETAEALDVPCLSGVPVGHIDDQWTIPLGAGAEVDADARALRVVAPAA